MMKINNEQPPLICVIRVCFLIYKDSWKQVDYVSCICSVYFNLSFLLQCVSALKAKVTLTLVLSVYNYITAQSPVVCRFYFFFFSYLPFFSSWHRAMTSTFLILLTQLWQVDCSADQGKQSSLSKHTT